MKEGRASAVLVGAMVIAVVAGLCAGAVLHNIIGLTGFWNLRNLLFYQPNPILGDPTFAHARF
ncbi:MAG: hypothetical protein Q7T82_00815 [Armatimonadota bacterium]|nr:hypothetical protein [Armatimonadota bacterium]